ncbi:MAG: DMT family transporter [Candidatus Tectomicrobia bacterium]|nr:DMT family transporter [Candidatus Tectomicrobia bacterium]
MPAELFALLAALFLGSATGCSGLALRTSTTLTVLNFSVVMNAVVLWLILLVRLAGGATSPFLTFRALVPFIVAGLFVPLIARIFFFEGVRRLGPSRTSFLSSSQPLLATMLGVLLLGESLALTTIAGTACIVGGVLLLAKRSPEQGAIWRWKAADVIFPLISASLFASRDALVRDAMFTLRDPYLAATAAATTSAVCLVSYMTARGRWRDLVISRSNFTPLFLSGVAAGVYYFFLFQALGRGRVSVVNPLVASSPLVVLLIAIIFMRGQELITRRLVLGGGLIMLGGFFITTF